MLVTLSMNFTNSPISPDELPTMADVAFHPLEKDFLVVERISLFIPLSIFLGIGASFFYFIENLQEPFIISVAVIVYVLIAVLRFLSISISFKYSGYALREKDVLYRSGWLKRKIRVVMLNRIQHVSVQSGPLERRFGLSSVSIFTAGSSEADFTINGITEHTAQRIKEWISTETNGDRQL